MAAPITRGMPATTNVAQHTRFACWVNPQSLAPPAIISVHRGHQARKYGSDTPPSYGYEQQLPFPNVCFLSA